MLLVENSLIKHSDTIPFLRLSLVPKYSSIEPHYFVLYSWKPSQNGRLQPCSVVEDARDQPNQPQGSFSTSIEPHQCSRTGVLLLLVWFYDRFLVLVCQPLHFCFAIPIGPCKEMLTSFEVCVPTAAPRHHQKRPPPHHRPSW